MLVTGEVPDVRPYLDRASVVVAPLRLGGGMRVKVAEALAAGKAVVATPLAAEGLGASHGDQLLLAHDAEAIAEAVQRPTMRFVATKTAEQLDLQALHRVRSRLVGERTAIANEIRAFLLDRGIAVAKGLDRLRAALPGILGTRTDVLFPRLLHIIEDLIADWRRLDQRIDDVSLEIEALAKADAGCERLMTVPGVGPIISSAVW